MKINYLFVDNFKWNFQEFTSRYSGKPEVGRIYRSIYNPEANWHLIVIDETAIKKAIITHTLECEDENFDFTGKLEILTKENIINHNILEEDLDKMIEWIDKNNEDILKKKEDVAPYQALQRAMNEQDLEDQEFLHYVMGIMEQLQLHNVIDVEILVELAQKLITESLETFDSPVSKLKLDRTNGQGANIVEALEAINRYSSENRKTNQDPDDLDKAIVSLIRERERRILNGLDE